VQRRPDDVPEGQWAIRIWARCEPSRTRMQAWRDAGADPDHRPRAIYKLVNVFDTLSRAWYDGVVSGPNRAIRAGEVEVHSGPLIVPLASTRSAPGSYVDRGRVSRALTGSRSAMSK
jgi:hypothetical protein